MATEFTVVDDDKHSNEAPPAVFLHICTVYERMKRDAQEVEGGHMYIGHLTKLLNIELGFAVPYYTTITQALKGMDCAEQVKRGGGSAPSEWLLKKQPTLEAYLDWDVRNKKKPHSSSQTAVLRQMVHDHGARIETLEETMSTLLEALRDK